MTDASWLRKRLKDGGHTVGTWQQIPDADISELLARAGYDWVAVDLEHGGIARNQLSSLFRAIELGGALPLARVAAPTMSAIKPALEAGAAGIILPMIVSRAQLDAAIHEILYPPAGGRGVGFCRANLYGAEFDAYMEKAASQLLVVAQIEHIDAVRDLEAIVSAPRLDAVFVGPYDLSGSMNLTAQFTHPDFEKVMERINRVCHEYAMPMGAHVVMPDPGRLERYIREGYQFLAYGIDSVFLRVGAARPETEESDS